MLLQQGYTNTIPQFKKRRYFSSKDIYLIVSEFLPRILGNFTLLFKLLWVFFTSFFARISTLKSILFEDLETERKRDSKREQKDREREKERLRGRERERETREYRLAQK